MTRQRNIFSAMMENYGKVLEYTENAQNAAGTSAQKYEHYLESLEAKINSLTVAWEEYVQHLNISKSYSAIIDVLNVLVNMLDFISGKTPILQTALSVILGFTAIKSIIPFVLKITSGFSNLFQTIKIGESPFKAMIQSFKNLDLVYAETGASLSAYQKQELLTVVTSKKLTNEQKMARIQALGLSEDNARLILTNEELSITNGMLSAQITALDENFAAMNVSQISTILNNNQLSISEKETAISTELLSYAQANNIAMNEKDAAAMAALIVEQNAAKVSAQGLTAAMSTLNLVVAAITVAITAAVWIFQACAQAHRENVDASKESVEALSKEAESVDEVVKKYSDLNEKLKKNNLSESEVYDIKTELLKVQDDLYDKYGEEAKQIDLVNGYYDTQIKKLKEISKEKKEQAVIEGRTAYKENKKTIKTKNLTWDININSMLAEYALDLYEDAMTADTAESQIKILNELYNIIEKDWQGMYKEDALDTISEAIAKRSTPEIKEAEKEIEEYQRLIIETNKEVEDAFDGENVYDLLSSARKKYNDALKSGSYDQIQQAKEEYQGLISTLGTVKAQTNDEILKTSLDNLITTNEEYFDNTTEKIVEYADKHKEIIDKVSKYDDTTIKAAFKSLENEDSDAISGIDVSIQQLYKDFNRLEVPMEDVVEWLVKMGKVKTIEPEKIFTYDDITEMTEGMDETLNSYIENINNLGEVISKIQTEGTIDTAKIAKLSKAGVDVSKILVKDTNALLVAENGLTNAENDLIDSYVENLEVQKEQLNTFLKDNPELVKTYGKQINETIMMMEAMQTSLREAGQTHAKSIDEYITSLSKGKDLIAQVTTYGVERISTDILQQMKDTYIGMTQYVDEYLLGAIDNKQLIDTFKTFYENDRSNFDTYMRWKYSNTQEFYQDWISQNSDWVNDLNTKYGIDLRNYKTYSEAKAKIEATGKTRSYMGQYLSDYLTDNGEFTSKWLEDREIQFKYDKKFYNTVMALHDVYTKFAIDANKKVSASFYENYDKMTGEVFKLYDDRLAKAKSVTKQLADNDNVLNRDIVNSMVDVYDGMSEYREQWIKKEISSDELVAKFKEFYERDKDNFAHALAEKKVLFETGIDNWLDDNKEWIDGLNDGYKRDLKNCKNYVELKNTLLSMIGEEFGEKSIFNIDDYVTEQGELTSKWVDYVAATMQSTGVLANVTGYDLITRYADLLSQLYADIGDEAKKTTEDIEDWVTSSVTDIKDYLDAVNNYLTQQVDYYQKIIDGISAASNLRIETLDKEIEKLQKENDEQQRAIDLQEKLEALNKAKTQRNVREYNAETGQFEWTTNKKEVQKAQREYDKALKEETIKQKQDEKTELEKYTKQFTDVKGNVDNQRAIQDSLRWLASYRGVDVSTLKSEDLLNLSDKEYQYISSRMANAYDTQQAFAEARENKENAKNNALLVSGGFASVGENGVMSLNWEKIQGTLGTSLDKVTSSLEKWVEILKPSSYAENKSTLNPVTTNITNNNQTSHSYVFSGDMTFKFDKVTDVDGFISAFVTKLDEKVAITPIK